MLHLTQHYGKAATALLVRGDMWRLTSQYQMNLMTATVSAGEKGALGHLFLPRVFKPTIWPLPRIHLRSMNSPKPPVKIISSPRASMKSWMIVLAGSRPILMNVLDPNIVTLASRVASLERVYVNEPRKWPGNTYRQTSNTSFPGNKGT